jgi:hypothetical protein
MPVVGADDASVRQSAATNAVNTVNASLERQSFVTLRQKI